MAYKQITPCIEGSPFDADFGIISVNDGDILYLTFTNPSFDGCYTVDGDVFGFTQTVVTTSLAYIDCSTCLADVTTPTPTPTLTPTPAYTEYGLTTFGYGDSSSACANLNPTPTVYASPGYNVPMVGMFFYSDNTLTTPYVGNGPGVWLLLTKDGNNWAAIVDTNGELLNYSICAVAPTQTPTTTPCIECQEYYNNSGPLYGFYYYDCSGVYHSDEFLDYGGSICTSGGLSGPVGYLTPMGVCGTYCGGGGTPYPTPTPTPTPNPAPTYTPTNTPTQTPCSVASFNGYSGLTLNNACNQLYPATIYYCGSLGVGTDLYSDSAFTNPVNTPGYYYDPNTTQVYHVGLPSVQDGRVTDIQSCPTPTGIWTITNYDCGLGSINDVGINSSFMNTLPLGPSTFPLTSTLGGSKAYPSGVINGTNLIQLNVTTNLPGVGGCALIFVYVNSVLAAQSQFDNNPFPQISVNLNIGDDVQVVVQCFGTPCSTPAPTSAVTSTPTPTPTTTPTLTPTPYRTVSASNNNEYGVNISSITSNFGITFNNSFPITYGNTINGIITSASIGDTVDINFTGGTPFEFYVYENGSLTSGYTSYSPTILNYTITQNLTENSGLLFQLVNATASPTPSPTQTETPTPTPTTTTTLTATQTPTTTTTLTVTPTSTSTNMPTPTTTTTPTLTPTPTKTQTPTPSVTLGLTPTATETSTSTPTPTQTQTPTAGYVVQFADCTNSNNIFRFHNINTVLTLGSVYLIAGSIEYTGCATVVANDGSGPLYDGTGVSFTQTASGCADPVCPRVSNRPALLYKCSDSTVFYANVEEDTAFVGAAYLYEGECYSFVEFSGPGGPNIGDPDYADCTACRPTPTPTSTPQNTPTNTPTVSVTPSACTYTDFCFYTMLPSLSGYSGNYTLAGTYNTKDYYTGDGTITAVVYYTGTYWCLASGATPGGTCVLQGATPCYSQCPDIAANDFFGGICPTPTPTPVDCSIFNFNAYFDCDWEPLPTPTPSVACDDVNFIIDSAFVTPTPTPSGDFCGTVGISFSMSGYTPAVTPTVTLTPSITLTRTVDVAGQVKFNMLDETFSCVSVKVLTDCQSGAEYYVNDNLVYDGIPVITGITMFASINETNVCATYTRDDSNFSANANVDAIFQIYANAADCSTLPTPTPTVTSTPTHTPTPTTTTTLGATQTPSETATQTPTQTPTATIGSTPTQTPSNTPTQTQTQTPTQTGTPTQTPTTTMTPTPSTTPNYVYVYQSCAPISPNLLPTQLIQSEIVSINITEGTSFRDTQGNCWSFIGKFESTYIAPQTVISITYTGNYFSGISTKVYTTCDECLTQHTVIGVSAYMQPCIGGTIDDYMGASVLLDSPVDVDTNIEVLVSLQYGNTGVQCVNGFNNSTTFTVLILAGQSFGEVNACQQGQYYPQGALVCGACAIGSDNPNINFGQSSC